MSKEVNLATLGKFAEAVNTGNFDLFDETVASGCVNHDPAPGQAPGPDEYGHSPRSRLRDGNSD
jgi:hypothetical protein